MNKNTNDWLLSLLQVSSVPSADIPNIDLYMDQITTFMDTHLADSRRYPEDKIMTKTMINNYTKNHLLPPSVKKKYSREHIFLLILIYRLKNMLSITDIQSILEPLTKEYFPTNTENGLSLKDIYDKLLSETSDRHPGIEKQILSDWENSRDSFAAFSPSEEDGEYLDDLIFIYKLCYDIYVRKQAIEKIIDCRRQKNSPAEKKAKKSSKNNKTE